MRTVAVLLSTLLILCGPQRVKAPDPPILEELDLDKDADPATCFGSWNWVDPNNHALGVEQFLHLKTFVRGYAGQLYYVYYTIVPDAFSTDGWNPQVVHGCQMAAGPPNQQTKDDTVGAWNYEAVEGYVPEVPTCTNFWYVKVRLRRAQTGPETPPWLDWDAYIVTPIDNN